MNQLNQTATDKVIGYLDKVSSKIGDFVAKLADQLGVASKHVYTILVNQQLYEGVVTLVYCGFWMLLWILSISMLITFAPKAKFGQEMIRADIITVIFIILGIFSTVANLFYSLDNFAPALQKILNPEYYAMKQVVDFIQQIAHGEGK